MTIEIAGSYGLIVLDWLKANWALIIPICISLWSIKNANAAKNQAKHAGTQATAAKIQAAAAERQSAVYARQLLLDKIEQYRSEIKAAGDLRSAVAETMLAAVDVDDGNPEAPENGAAALRIQAAGASLRTFADAFEVFAASEPDLAERTQARRFIASQGHRQSNAAQLLAMRVRRNMTAGPLNLADTDEPLARIINESDALQTHCDTHPADLQREIERLWVEVRIFEVQIRGGINA